MSIFEFREAADAAADDAAAAERVVLREVDAAIEDGLVGGVEGELREAIEPANRLGLDAVLGLEVLDFAAEADLELGGIEERERRDAAVPGQQAVPVVRHGVGERIDCTQTGDDDAAAGHRDSQGRGCGYALGLAAAVLVAHGHLDMLDRLADGLDLFGLVVGNLDVELFFEFHHELHDVERVGPDIFDEAGLFGHLVLVDRQVFADDVDDFLANLLVGHARFLQGGAGLGPPLLSGVPPPVLYRLGSAVRFTRSTASGGLRVQSVG